MATCEYFFDFFKKLKNMIYYFFRKTSSLVPMCTKYLLMVNYNMLDFMHQT
jgi:hypothetical protein